METPRCLAMLKFVEHNFLLGFLQVFSYRIDVGIPHIHSHDFNTRFLFLRQRSPESIQTFLFAIFRHVQYAAAP